MFRVLTVDSLESQTILDPRRLPTAAVPPLLLGPDQAFNPCMWFGVLGSLELRDDSGHSLRVGGPMRRALLPALLCRWPRTVPADHRQPGRGTRTSQEALRSKRIAVAG